MAQTKDLLHLASEFPGAFSDPEETRYPHPESVDTPQTEKQDSITDAKTQQLLQLINEFPIAFADLEKPNKVGSKSSLETEAGSTTQVMATSASESITEIPGLDETKRQGDKGISSPPLPSLVSSGVVVPAAGYAHALYRQVQTLTWGQIDFHLTYGESGLEAVWAVAGKSGTEVQSLCEAICRLVNLLLLEGTPISKIVREIRGIRGADSEGLGPNRILGLADLIGKVLQEAPAQSSSAQLAELPIASSPFAEEHQTIDKHAANLPEIDQSLTSVLQPTIPEESMASRQSQTGEASLSQIFSQTEVVTSELCPECGAELQQVTGCKGGACVVCGYSSCS